MSKGFTPEGLPKGYVALKISYTEWYNPNYTKDVDACCCGSNEFLEDSTSNVTHVLIGYLHGDKWGDPITPRLMDHVLDTLPKWALFRELPYGEGHKPYVPKRSY